MLGTLQRIAPRYIRRYIGRHRARPTIGFIISLRRIEPVVEVQD